MCDRISRSGRSAIRCSPSRPIGIFAVMWLMNVDVRIIWLTGRVWRDCLKTQKLIPYFPDPCGPDLQVRPLSLALDHSRLIVIHAFCSVYECVHLYYLVHRTDLERLLYNMQILTNEAGLQPFFPFPAQSWGFAPGWYRSRFQRFKIIDLSSLPVIKRAEGPVSYQPGAKPRD